MLDDNAEIEKFPSNSLNAQTQRQKAEEEPTKKVVVKQIVTGKRVTESVVKSTLRNVGFYILWDILIPAAKNTLSDMINNGSDMVLYGEPKTRRRDRDRDRGASRVSYSSYYDRDKDHDRSYDKGRDRLYARSSRFNSDEILLATREDAEEVIQSMYDVFDQYNAVTVSEFLELVGLPDEYTDRSYGWTNLREIQVRRVRDGYVVDLPPPRVLPR
jgi:hypothetical protein